VYEDFFRLERAPFGLTPDPRFLLRAKVHHEALASALYGLGSDKGLMAVIGDVGTGKTTLCRALLEDLPPEVESALILNPYLTDAELLAAILDDLGAPRAGESKGELMEALVRHLLARAEAGRRVAVVLDEAQHLSVDALEQVRILTTLETATRKLLQVVLVGQPELVAKLRRPELRQLDQRIGIRCHLRPLGDRETARYVEHRMRVAGLDGSLPFTRAALRRVWEATGGVPRVINLVCDRALTAAWQDGAAEVGPRHVAAAAAAVRARRRPTWARRSRRAADAVTIAAGALAFAILAGAGLQAWRHGWPLPVVSLFTGQAFPVRAMSLPPAAAPGGASREGPAMSSRAAREDGSRP
jgi:general secretion pathway protein A